jgi:hypothetical protein
VTFSADAAQLGAWCWLERRLFEVVGGWVATTPEPEVKVHLATACHHHAWRAEQLERLLPNAYAGPRAELVAAPDDGVVVDRLATFEGSVERLAGLYRVVVPRALSSYRWHLERCNPATDGPSIRTVRIIATDVRDDWALGEALLQSRLGGINDVDRAAHAAAKLEKDLVNPPLAGNRLTAFRR